MGLAFGAAVLAACGGGSELTLTLSDAVFTASAGTRIVIFSPDVSFPVDDTMEQIQMGCSSAIAMSAETDGATS